MGLHKHPDGCILFLDLFFKNRERPERRSPMVPKHTIYCLGEVLLALDADAPLAHAESFRPRLDGDAAVLAQACAAQGGCASLLAQLGEDPFGQRAASTLAAAGVDTAHTRFSRTLPTALLFEAGGEALSYRMRTAGLQFAPEQLEPGLFQPGDALLFASSGLCDSPLRYTHLAALTAARDAGALTCFAPCLEPALWPQPEREAAPREVTRQLLPRADIVLLTTEELEFLFGTAEMRVALFPLLRGHTQLVLLACAEGIHAFTRTNHAFWPGLSLPAPRLAAKALCCLLQKNSTPEKLPRLTTRQLQTIL
ncbi:carbohydrate kinase [Faecalibacterium prausnitzii]|uniref:Carbohydrate kinase n=2 Tax=Faecalibacterium prausnitzii TaxID=853 RepID=A0A329U5F7_9FIRM|nr:carbohydrate kinase [Faecalibacterium prausnitzii]